MRATTLVLIFVAFLAYVSAQTCNLKLLSDAQTTLDNMMKKARDTPTAYGQNEAGQELGTLINTVNPCLELAASYVNFASTPVTVMTDGCTAEEGTPQFATDPCCNQTLTLTRCCAVRNTTDTDIDVASTTATFKDATKGCRDQTNAVYALGDINDFFKKTYPQCVALLTQATNVLTTQQKTMQACNNIYTSPGKCESNAQCFQGGVCNARTRKCVYDPVDGTPLVACVFSKISAFGISSLKLSYGLNQSATAAQVLTPFLGSATQMTCINADGVATAQSTQATCLAAASSNVHLAQLGTAPTTGNFGCGGFCKANGVCDITYGASTQAACASAGYCYGDGTNMTQTAADCSKTMQCSLYDQCNQFSTPACNKTLCESQGVCQGYQLPDGCFLPHIFSEGIACPGSSIFTELGCLDLSVGSSAACTAGKWMAVPKTKAECEAFMGCYDTVAQSYLPSSILSSQCTTCGGVQQKRYTWVVGVWQTSTFEMNGKWLKQESVPVNRWVAVVTETLYTKTLNNVFAFQNAPNVEGMLGCAASAYLEVLKPVACDCGTGRSTNGTCYAAPQPVAVGIARAFPGIPSTIRNPEVDCFVENDTISSSDSSAAVEIQSAPNLDKKKALSAPSAYYDMFNIHFLNQQVLYYTAPVSNGLNARNRNGKNFAGNGLRMCIKVNRKVKLTAAYKTAGFATRDASGNYMKATGVNSVVENKQLGTICAKVVQPNVYYAAYFTDNIITPRTSARTSARRSAGRVSARVSRKATQSARSVFLAFVAVVFSVVAFMF